ncbi:hypothetical protein [Azomonas macrocytogenes]|uniref:Uncharacterized protein n=1 Tax=Azomonas macrocytogenes TaxID=69962 RepID=A0A839T4R6_AZOMA|nr:hypothetical protein [Azomonas macrocytogenes]MBB3102915.1 hypothetical protein [Azomonas macrocytogenes]
MRAGTWRTVAGALLVEDGNDLERLPDARTDALGLEDIFEELAR